jgi:hypothetical protein
MTRVFGESVPTVEKKFGMALTASQLQVSPFT